MLMKDEPSELGRSVSIELAQPALTHRSAARTRTVRPRQGAG
jgi:hypothetical protein